MDTKEINLLQENRPKDRFDETKRKKETLLNVIIIAGFISFIVAIYAYGLMLSQQVRGLADSVMAKEASINSMKDREYWYRVVKLKISAVDEILNQRKDLVPILDFIESVTAMIEETMPDGIKLDSLSVPSLTDITISGTAKDSKILDTFIVLLTETDLKPYFKNIKLTNLSRADEEEYVFGLSLTLDELKVQ